MIKKRLQFLEELALEGRSRFLSRVVRWLILQEPDVGKSFRGYTVIEAIVLWKRRESAGSLAFV